MSLRSWYDDRVVPRLVDVALSDRAAGSWRAAVCGGVSGEVLEVGFASGRNLPHYPAAVRRVFAVEPADLAWERAGERVAAFRASGREVERVGLDGAVLPVPDASVDAVVSTWTLCTIPDLDSALREFQRVLRPGGSVLFAEHTIPSPAALAAFGRAIQPAWGVLAGGCHLDRDIEAELERAAYRVSVTRSEGWFRAGTARPA